MSFPWHVLIINCVVSVLLIIFSYYLWGDGIAENILAVVFFVPAALNLLAWLKRILIIINSVNHLKQFRD